VEDADVLVVGAGPTGLMVAGELARHGVLPMLVDAREGCSVHSKALAVHSRTLEVFEDVGVAEEALRRGRRMHGVNAYAAGRRIVNVGFDELDAPHPYVLILPQGDTEEILEARARSLGVEVQRQTKLVALVQDDEAVTATLEDQSGARRDVRARWLVACDGAHSTVRAALGTPWEGEDIDARFVIADVRVSWELDPDEARIFFSTEGVLAFFPLPEDGRWRIVATIASERAPDPPTLDFFRGVYLERSHIPATIDEPTWLSTFTIRQRKVARYRTGRVFLAGDAAHAHSPIGGQGMNTGLQDAYNLAWKLALVSRGLAAPSFLDSYHAEREPVATGVLFTTGVQTRVVTLRHPVAQAIRNHLAPVLTSLEVVQQRAARATGELDVAYRKSPIVEERRAGPASITIGRAPGDERPTLGDARDFGSGPRAGERAPDADLGDGRRLHELLWGTRHVLLAFDGEVASSAGYEGMRAIAGRARARFGDLLRAVMIVPGERVPPELQGEEVVLDRHSVAHRRWGAGAECIYVVRPDGYVGFRSQPPDAERLVAWADRWLNPAS
jgi:2-polyprenyl-6-methoxyphenol hydroxylase-like FAD-dependent oxidoreductase